MKTINTWEALAQLPDSETHYLDIDVGGCNGWVLAKNPVSNKFSDRKKYLSTHTFYGECYKYSTALLQSCGFDAEIANWDKETM